MFVFIPHTFIKGVLVVTFTKLLKVDNEVTARLFFDYILEIAKMHFGVQ